MLRRPRLLPLPWAKQASRTCNSGRLSFVQHSSVGCLSRDARSAERAVAKAITRYRTYNPEMQFWELDRLRVAAHHPQVLRSDDDANRVIALLLPQGESLQEHQVHEHALVFVVRGELLVSAGASERTLSAPSLI